LPLKAKLFFWLTLASGLFVIYRFLPAFQYEEYNLVIIGFLALFAFFSEIYEIEIVPEHSITVSTAIYLSGTGSTASGNTIWYRGTIVIGCTGIVCSGSQQSVFGNTIWNPYRGIEADSGAYYSAITGNVIRLPTGVTNANAIYTAADDISVVGNSIHLIGTTPIGISSGGTNTCISGNMVTGTGTHITTGPTGGVGDGTYNFADHNWTP